MLVKVTQFCEGLVHSSHPHYTSQKEDDRHKISYCLQDEVISNIFHCKSNLTLFIFYIYVDEVHLSGN